MPAVERMTASPLEHRLRKEFEAATPSPIKPSSSISPASGIEKGNSDADALIRQYDDFISRSAGA